MDLIKYIDDQIEWSKRTFAGGKRTLGITRHISKELKEIEESPDDLLEWIDVIILALDGAWRTGVSSEDIVNALKYKQIINFGRVYPMPKDDDTPSEHIDYE